MRNSSALFFGSLSFFTSNLSLSSFLLPLNSPFTKTVLASRAGVSRTSRPNGGGSSSSSSLSGKQQQAQKVKGEEKRERERASDDDDRASKLRHGISPRRRGFFCRFLRRRGAF